MSFFFPFWEREKREKAEEEEFSETGRKILSLSFRIEPLFDYFFFIFRKLVSPTNVVLPSSLLMFPACLPSMHAYWVVCLAPNFWSFFCLPETQKPRNLLKDTLAHSAWSLYPYKQKEQLAVKVFTPPPRKTFFCQESLSRLCFNSYSYSIHIYRELQKQATAAPPSPAHLT